MNVDGIWNNKMQGYMSSPVVIDQHIYLHLKNRRFACLDLKTGEEQWITKPFGEYWSLIPRAIASWPLTSGGELLLIRANPQEFELFTRQKVSDDSSWAHLAHDKINCSCVT